MSSNSGPYQGAGEVVDGSIRKPESGWFIICAAIAQITGLESVADIIREISKRCERQVVPMKAFRNVDYMDWNARLGPAWEDKARMRLGRGTYTLIFLDVPEARYGGLAPNRMDRRMEIMLAVINDYLRTQEGFDKILPVPMSKKSFWWRYAEWVHCPFPADRVDEDGFLKE